MANSTGETYRAVVIREDGWWMIHIPELDLTTQAAHRAEIETMAKGVVSAHLNISASDFDCVIEEVETTR